MRPKLLALSLIALSVLSACAGLRNRESDADALARFMDHSSEPVDSFSYLGRFDGWRALGRDRLVIFTGMNKAYLLKVAPPCQDLQFASAVGLEASSSVVYRGFDAVRVGPDRCMITEIRPVNYGELRKEERELREASAKP